VCCCWKSWVRGMLQTEIRNETNQKTCFLIQPFQEKLHWGLAQSFCPVIPIAFPKLSMEPPSSHWPPRGLLWWS
jgi:hypothetical protein